MEISAKEGYWKLLVIRFGMAKWLDHADNVITGELVRFLYSFDFFLRTSGLLNILRQGLASRYAGSSSLKSHNYFVVFCLSCLLAESQTAWAFSIEDQYSAIPKQFRDLRDVKKGTGRTPLAACRDYMSQYGGSLPYKLEVSVEGAVIHWDPSEEPYTVRGPACTGLLSSNPNNPEPFGFEIYTRGEVNFFKNMSNDCSSVTNNGTNPVNIGTGNKFQNEIDHDSNTLSFERTFNNGIRSLNLGNGWRSNFDRLITRDALFPDSTIYLYRENGSVLRFYLFDNNWKTDADNYDRLTELKDVNGTLIGWQYLVAIDDSVETYNAAGRLLSIVNRAGHTLSFTYDTNSRLITVNDDFGRVLRFTYDSSNRIATLTDPAGELYQYGYDTNGNLTLVTYPDNESRIYHYNEPAYTSGTDLPSALTGITDENGIRYATYRYAQGGETISTEHANGVNRHQLTYNPDGSTTVTDPLGTQRTHHFQAVLGLVKSAGQSQPGGAGCDPAALSITYDDNGNVVSQTDFNGNKTCYAYNLARNLEIARIEGLAAEQACPADLVSHVPAASTTERKILTDWHANFRLPVNITEVDREISMAYDDHGNLTRYSLSDLATNATRTWTTNHLYHPDVPSVKIQSIVDGPRTDVTDITTIDYYAPDGSCSGEHFGCRGQIRQITNALGHVIQIARYNPHGQPEEIIDPNGLVTTLTYDVRQRLLSNTQGTEITRYDYDAVGQLIKLTFHDDSFIRYHYDTAHRLIRIADNLGNRIDYTLDAMGNRIKEEVFDSANTLTETRQREFDALGRLWKAIGAQNQITELGYDPNGNLKQNRNPLTHTTNHHFDALNRLIQINDPAGGQSQQTYDALDRVVNVTDPRGVTTTYTYNGLGDLVREDSADRGITTYVYDAAGNLISRTDARGVVEATSYDALNRPISRTYKAVAGVPDTSPITWHYDEGTYGIGQLTRMQDESGTTTYQYDQHGRLLSQTQTVSLGKDNATHTLSYRYDQAGRLTQMTYPSGTRIAMLYDENGRHVEMQVNDQVLIRNISYQPFGGPKNWVWGNGQPHSRDFDRDGRLIQHPLAEGMQSINYDAASRITQTSHTNPIYNRSYDYDVLDRLTHQLTNTSSYQWQYDVNGNRTHAQPGTSVYLYTLDSASNRLLSVAGPVAKSYSYDSAGNPLTDGHIQFTWNAANRLSEVTTKGSIAYRYNGHGERVVKAGEPRTKIDATFFGYDLSGKLVGEYEAGKGKKKENSWQVKQETVWLGDIPIAVLKKTVKNDAIEIFYIQADHLNTPRVIVDQSHTPVWRWDNVDPFGANLPDEDADGDRKPFEFNLRFAGQYFDQETQLHYNYLRDYDPNTGRYLQSDPIGLAGGLNPYSYVFNNPLQYTDPTGEAVPAIALWLAGGALTLLDMLKPMTPHPQFPDAIESVWTIPGPVSGARKLCRAADGVSSNKTEIVQRWMSKVELEATKTTGLLRGGRNGTHYVTDAANTNKLRARQRLALPQTPEVRVTLEVPRGAFSQSSRIEPAFNMPGGGMERTATGRIPVNILEIR